MSNRIKSDKVLVGKSYVINANSNFSQEIKDQYTRIIEGAKAEAKKIILESKAKAKIEADSIINQANDLLTQANSKFEEADRIVKESVDKAQSEYDNILNTAKEEGYKIGFETGYKDGHFNITKELEDKIISVNDFAKSNFELKKRIIKSAHLDIIKLVLAISKKICQEAIETDRNILINVVNNSINSLNDRENIKIIVNPVMYNRILEVSDKMKEIILNLKSIEILQDRNVATDGVIVESLDTRIDGTVTSQIDELSFRLLTDLQMTSEDTLVNEIREDYIEEDKSKENNNTF